MSNTTTPTTTTDNKQITYVIEHMETEFSEWVKLEYSAIVDEVGSKNLYLSSIPNNKPTTSTSTTTNNEILPKEILDKNIQWTHIDITNFQELYPNFDKSKVCLLDPSATQELIPSDVNKFDFFLFGGILGDHPPRDRTGELRKYGFEGRHLGKIQMTTDTAVRVSQIVLKDQSKYKYLFNYYI